VVRQMENRRFWTRPLAKGGSRNDSARVPVPAGGRSSFEVAERLQYFRPYFPLCCIYLIPYAIRLILALRILLQYSIAEVLSHVKVSISLLLLV